MLAPQFFGPGMQKKVKDKLFEDIEGTCQGMYVGLYYNLIFRAPARSQLQCSQDSLCAVNTGMVMLFVLSMSRMLVKERFSPAVVMSCSK